MMNIDTLPRTAEVVIIGGGIMGASTAYHLALAGQRNVIVLERTEHFEDSATNRCAGGVRYQFSTEINIELSKASLPMIEGFGQEIGVDPQYRTCGYLLVATNPDDAATFKGNIALQNELGVQSRWLSGDETRGMVPQMRFEDALGASFHDKDGLADPGSMLMGYHRRSREMGAQVATGVEVIGVLVESGGVTGVDTKYGMIEAPIVVNAAGPWAGRIGEMAGVEIPIHPLRRQMITTTPLPELDPELPFVVDFAQSLYFHREGEGVLTGMSNPDERVGFDQRVDEEWELEAMQAAMERLPLLERAGRLSGWAGLYEVTPDAHPIFGATPVRGFYVVGGFSGHGFMHGPISGKLMSEIILDGAAETVDVSTLSLDRFEAGNLIQEHNVI